MALADDIAARYNATVTSPDDATPGSEPDMDDSGMDDKAAGKAAIAAVRKGDWEAFVEAVRSIRQ